jgi:hypothetical protein
MKANDVADWIGTLNVEELIELRQIARENVVRKRNGTYTVVMPGPGAKPWQNKLAKFIASWF